VITLLVKEQVVIQHLMLWPFPAVSFLMSPPHCILYPIARVCLRRASTAVLLQAERKKGADRPSIIMVSCSRRAESACLQSPDAVFAWHAVLPCMCGLHSQQCWLKSEVCTPNSLSTGQQLQWAGTHEAPVSLHSQQVCAHGEPTPWALVIFY
jgi:hypothetical protein